MADKPKTNVDKFFEIYDADPALQARYAHILPDLRCMQDLYRVLHAAMTVADQCVSEAASEEAFDEKREGAFDEAGLTGEELTLLAGLFEAAYSGDAEYMRDKIEELKAVLHRRHIEVVDCSESTHSFFDQMPSEREGTLRPALLSDGKVLRRGLAHEPLLRI